MRSVNVLLEIFRIHRHSPARHLASVGIYNGISFARYGDILLLVSPNHRRTVVDFRAFPSRKHGRQVIIGLWAENDFCSVFQMKSHARFQFDASFYVVRSLLNDDCSAAVFAAIVNHFLQNFSRSVLRQTECLVGNLRSADACGDEFLLTLARNTFQVHAFGIERWRNLADCSIGIVT